MSEGEKILLLIGTIKNPALKIGSSICKFSYETAMNRFKKREKRERERERERESRERKREYTYRYADVFPEKVHENLFVQPHSINCFFLDIIPLQEK